MAGAGSLARSGPSPRAAAALVLAGAAATIVGALVFERGFGLLPCPLCLQQRYPYYVAMPILALALVAGRRDLLRGALGVAALIFLISAGLGGYHAGIEWGFWAGPSDCGATGGQGPATTGDLLSSLSKAQVVSCSEAAWRFLGLSLAGWNVLISLALAGLSLRGAVAGSLRTAPSRPR